MRAIAFAFLSLMTACQPVPLVAPETEWRLTRLNDAAFDARATLRIPQPDSFDGEAPCNAYSGTFTGGDGTGGDGAFRPGAVRATRRACPDLAAESAFFAALDAVTGYEITRDSLILTGPDTRLEFTPVPPS